MAEDIAARADEAMAAVAMISGGGAAGRAGYAGPSMAVFLFEMLAVSFGGDAVAASEKLHQ